MKFRAFYLLAATVICVLFAGFAVHSMPSRPGMQLEPADPDFSPAGILLFVLSLVITVPAFYAAGMILDSFGRAYPRLRGMFASPILLFLAIAIATPGYMLLNRLWQYAR